MPDASARVIRNSFGAGAGLALLAVSCAVNWSCLVRRMVAARHRSCALQAELLAQRDEAAPEHSMGSSGDE